MIVQDDVAIPDERQGKIGARGLAGTVFVHKIAGYMASISDLEIDPRDPSSPRGEGGSRVLLLPSDEKEKKKNERTPTRTRTRTKDALDHIADVAQRVADRTLTVGCALSTCTVPRDVVKGPGLGQGGT